MADSCLSLALLVAIPRSQLVHHFGPISQQLLHGLLWIVFQMFKVQREWVLFTLIVPTLFLSRHNSVHICDFYGHFSTIVISIVISFVGLTTLPLVILLYNEATSSGQNLNSNWFYSTSWTSIVNLVNIICTIVIRGYKPIGNTL